MTKFEVGKQYYMRSIGNYDCIWRYEVIKRTAKTVTLKQIGRESEPINRKISIYDNGEMAMPLGSYSMAPCLRAENVITQEPEEVKQQPTNVIDFTTKRNAKQEQEESQAMIDRFKSEYLPYFTNADIETILTASEDRQASAIINICVRIDLERGAAQC